MTTVKIVKRPNFAGRFIKNNDIRQLFKIVDHPVRHLESEINYAVPHHALLNGIRKICAAHADHPAAVAAAAALAATNAVPEPFVHTRSFAEVLTHFDRLFNQLAKETNKYPLSSDDLSALHVTLSSFVREVHLANASVYHTSPVFLEDLQLTVRGVGVYSFVGNYEDDADHYVEVVNKERASNGRLTLTTRCSTLSSLTTSWNVCLQKMKNST